MNLGTSKSIWEGGCGGERKAKSAQEDYVRVVDNEAQTPRPSTLKSLSLITHPIPLEFFRKEEAHQSVNPPCLGARASLRPFAWLTQFTRAGASCAKALALPWTRPRLLGGQYWKTALPMIFSSGKGPHKWES